MSDGQIETFNERCIEGFRIFRIKECLFEISFVTDDHSAIHFADTIIPSCLDNLGIETFAEAFANGTLIKFVSIGGD